MDFHFSLHFLYHTPSKEKFDFTRLHIFDILCSTPPLELRGWGGLCLAQEHLDKTSKQTSISPKSSENFFILSLAELKTVPSTFKAQCFLNTAPRFEKQEDIAAQTRRHSQLSWSTIAYDCFTIMAANCFSCNNMIFFFPALLHQHPLVEKLQI